MSEQPKRPIGRPRKDTGGAPRVNVMMRLTATTRDRLMAYGKEHGRSMSEEIERRLEQSFLAEDVSATVERAIAREFSRRDEPVAPLGSPPPAYAQ